MANVSLYTFWFSAPDPLLLPLPQSREGDDISYNRKYLSYSAYIWASGYDRAYYSSNNEEILFLQCAYGPLFMTEPLLYQQWVYQLFPFRGVTWGREWFFLTPVRFSSWLAWVVFWWLCPIRYFSRRGHLCLYPWWVRQGKRTRR